ncbi:MAG: SH3 domain-containing protein [Lachnospiraceae bacterium]|nr:SH3 domain-containing protein [Lachnospiraceae bacterium]
MSIKGLYSGRKWLISAGIVFATALFGFYIWAFTSFAASSGKITTDGARVRKDASTNSDIVTSLAKNDSITINGQTTGADGLIWYQITTAAGESGYVRSDLASVTDGSTPDTIGADGNVTAGDPNIRLVNPISGTVTYDQKVRVRQDASTSSTIIEGLDNGTVVTINGVKNGTDGREWYYISFNNAEGNEVVGFSRSDFITPSGELTDLSTEAPAEDTQEEPATEEPAEPEEPKDFETELQDGEWYLLDYKGTYNNGEASKFKISEIFENLETYKEAANKNKGNKLVVPLIIFIIIAIAGLGGAAYLFLKLREVNDQAAFADAEKQRRARLAGGQGSTRPSGSQSGRPAQSGQRPAQGGARPAGAPNGRPAQGGSRPMPGPNGRPAGRPAGAPAGRPAGAPAGRPVQGGSRPMPGPNGRPAGRPAGAPTGRPIQRPAGDSADYAGVNSQNRQQKPENDDFDYDFLNSNE